MRRYTRRLLVIMFLAVAVCAIYWQNMLGSQREQIVYAEEQTRLRAARLADVLAIQVSTLFSGLEYLVSSLAVEYQVNPEDYFPLSVHTALSTFPKDSIVQISVANAQGDLVYTSMDVAGIKRGSTEPEHRINIADREHFQVHLQRMDNRFFIGHPVLGRVSKRWTIPVSYPIRRDGVFQGVLVLSVSPDYISGYFRDAFTSGKDSALLLLDDGTYLARSSQQDQALSQSVPPDREFLQSPNTLSGQYQAAPALDGVERFYAWHRVPSYPLVISIGLERARSLTVLQEHLYNARVRNGVAIILVLALVFWVAMLIVRLKRDQQLLAASEQRLKLALKGGELGAWDWDMVRQTFRHDQAWGKMLGYEVGELRATKSLLNGLLHPDDVELVKGRLQRYIRGETPLFESEHRMRHRDGRWVWVSVRGGITTWTAEGQAAWLAGTQADISARMEDAHMRQALFDNNAAEILLTHPRDRSILLANRRAVETFAPDGEVLVGASMRSLHVNEDDFKAFSLIYQELCKQGSVQIEQQLRTASGEPRWYSISGTLLDPLEPDGEVIWTMLDITRRRQTEQNFANAQVRLIEVIGHVPGGVLVEDEHGVILLTNAELCRMLSIDAEASTLVGTKVEDLPQRLSIQDAAMLRASVPLVASGQAGSVERELHYHDRVLQVSIMAVQREGYSLGRLWILNDITERLRHESDLNRMATTDALTGLANRAAFLARLDLELRQAANSRRGVLLMADLDHFKAVNDTYGHGAGDEVLRFVANIFQTVLRKSDLVGRLGGEEFAVLLPGVSDDEGMVLAQRIRVALETSSIQTAAGVVRVTISLGMARLTQGSATEVLAVADAALYKAKRSGRNRVEVGWES